MRLATGKWTHTSIYTYRFWEQNRVHLWNIANSHGFTQLDVNLMAGYKSHKKGDHEIKTYFTVKFLNFSFVWMRPVPQKFTTGTVYLYATGTVL